MSESQSIYMWENVDIIIQRIDSRIDLVSKTIYLYDSHYCSKDNEDCSLQPSHIIRNFVQMKKPFEFLYGFKSHSTSINESLSMLKGCLN